MCLVLVEYKGLGDILCSLFLIIPDYGRKNFMSSLHLQAFSFGFDFLSSVCYSCLFVFGVPQSFHYLSFSLTDGRSFFVGTAT
jgi:hypothetical protein